MRPIYGVLIFAVVVVMGFRALQSHDKKVFAEVQAQCEKYFAQVASRTIDGEVEEFTFISCNKMEVIERHRRSGSAGGALIGGMFGYALAGGSREGVTPKTIGGATAGTLVGGAVGGSSTQVESLSVSCDVLRVTLKDDSGLRTVIISDEAHAPGNDLGLFSFFYLLRNRLRADTRALALMMEPGMRVRIPTDLPEELRGHLSVPPRYVYLGSELIPGVDFVIDRDGKRIVK